MKNDTIAPSLVRKSRSKITPTKLKAALRGNDGIVRSECQIMSGDRKAEAKRLYLEEGLTQDAIAKQFGVARRTIERWAKEDEWGAQKKARTVVPIGEAKSKAQPKPVNTPDPTPYREPMRSRSLKRRGELDELEIVEDAIDSLSALITGCLRGGITDNDERTTAIDTRGIGGTASALVRLLEYRRKLKPPTAAELAELAIGMNVTPEQFMQALRDAWRLRA